MNPDDPNTVSLHAIVDAISAAEKRIRERGKASPAEKKSLQESLRVLERVKTEVKSLCLDQSDFGYIYGAPLKD